MTLSAFIAGLFAIFESIPIIRDALYSAIDGIIATRVEAARQGRLQAYDELRKAANDNDSKAAAAALGAIVRNRPK